jgi:putative aldouronate transport system permease protein
MVEHSTLGSRIATWGMSAFLIVVAILMLFPFLYVFSISFSTFEDVARGGVILWPRNWSLDAYTYVLGSSVMTRAIGVSIFLATVGTLVNLFMTTTMAYALASPHLRLRKFFLVLVLIPILFGPAMIPRYLVVKATGLLDSVWALILPTAISAFYLIVMRNFFMSIPRDLHDAAELDGASDLRILWDVVLPLSKPILAAIGLFYAVGHWNSYFNAVLYINDPAKWPVQVLLRLVVIQGQADTYGGGSFDTLPPPAFTVQMATVIIATVPILIVYPFLQKHFTKGMLTGSIKG